MRRIIRTFIVLVFISMTVGSLACADKRFSQSGDQGAKRPLQTPKVTTDKPKIIAFGDSLTAGFGLAEKESYPYLLQQRLRSDGYDYEVVNAGISGDTTVGGLERSDWVLNQENAKIVIIELGANDMLRGMPVAKMKANLDKIIQKAKAKNLTVLLCGMLAPPTANASYGRDFISAFPDLAAEHKVAFLPFLLENVAAIKNLNQADGIHPNAEGERIMTENIYKALQPLLTK